MSLLTFHLPNMFLLAISIAAMNGLEKSRKMMVMKKDRNFSIKIA